MGNVKDSRTVFTAMHHDVTGELLHLMDGFYSNIEDSLFELAFRTGTHEQRKHCFDLMREMRYRRTSLIQTFAKRMQRAGAGWSGNEPLPVQNPKLQTRARALAEKCHSHFGPLLRNIRERAAYGSDQDPETYEVPISPVQISYHFLASCHSLKFDKHAIKIVQTLFARFVLDRLGSIYGDCNKTLEAAGYHNVEEVSLVSSA